MGIRSNPRAVATTALASVLGLASSLVAQLDTAVERLLARIDSGG